jgi:hypothetical protein
MAPPKVSAVQLLRNCQSIVIKQFLQINAISAEIYRGSKHLDLVRCRFDTRCKDDGRVRTQVE